MTRANADVEREQRLTDYVEEHEYWLERTNWWWPRFLLWLLRKTT